MQITVKERNDWEGETWNYILDVEPEVVDIIKNEFRGRSDIEVYEETEYTQEEIDQLNGRSDNTYMDEYGFYEPLTAGKLLYLKDINGDLYDDVFYKAKGLKRV